MDIKKVIELHRLAMTAVHAYPAARPLLAELDHQEGRHFTGILGPRGVGKTL